MSGTRNFSGLIEQVSTCIEAAYNKGYKAAKQDIVAIGNKSEYARGLSDAERAMRRLCLNTDMGGLSCRELDIIFGKGTTAQIINSYSMSEIIEKIREYDEHKEESVKDENEINVGDEVYYIDENKQKIVTCIDGKNVTVLCSSGKSEEFDISELHKTGRHYDIADLLGRLGKDLRKSMSY